MGEVVVVDGLEERSDEDGPAVDEKESVVLSRAQNCLASVSAEDTLPLQLAAMQLRSASGNVLLLFVQHGEMHS